MSHVSALQILLDEELALEIADDWSKTDAASNYKGNIAIRNFHLLRRAAKVASSGGKAKSKLAAFALAQPLKLHRMSMLCM